MQRVRENLTYLVNEKGVQIKDLSRQLGIPRSTLYAGNLNIDSLMKVCEYFEIEPTELIYSECKLERRSVFMKDWVRTKDLAIFKVNINDRDNYIDEITCLIRKINHIDIDYKLVGKKIVAIYKYELQNYVNFTSSVIVRSESSSSGTYYNTLLDNMEEEKNAIDAILDVFNSAFINIPEDWVRLFFYKYFMKYNRKLLMKTDISSKNNIYGCITSVSQAIRDSVKVIDYSKILKS